MHFHGRTPLLSPRQMFENSNSSSLRRNGASPRLQSTTNKSHERNPRSTPFFLFLPSFTMLSDSNAARPSKLVTANFCTRRREQATPATRSCSSWWFYNHERNPTCDTEKPITIPALLLETRGSRITHEEGRASLSQAERQSSPKWLHERVTVISACPVLWDRAFKYMRVYDGRVNDRFPVSTIWTHAKPTGKT